MNVNYDQEIKLTLQEIFKFATNFIATDKFYKLIIYISVSYNIYNVMICLNN